MALGNLFVGLGWAGRRRCSHMELAMAIIGWVLWGLRMIRGASDLSHWQSLYNYEQIYITNILNYL